MLYWLQKILLVNQAYLSILVGYLLLLTGSAFKANRQTQGQAKKPNNRFLFLIPAHNEERLLPSLLANLSQLDYPHALYEIHVVADNCTDGTADVARSGGAIVHERMDDKQRGKGYALQWLLTRLWETAVPHDAIVILDADSIVSKNFLQVMDARLAQGERVIQAYYAVREPEQSWSVSLRYAALAVLHYLRPQGRMVMGGSAGLKGNGMVFTADLIKQHEWSASLTEDIEFHMALILAGERVTFAPDAIVSAEMPATLAAAHTQNVRWERGRLQTAVQYVPQLLKGAWKERGGRGNGRFFVLFDAAMEHLIPPFSLLAAWSGLGLLAAIVIPGKETAVNKTSTLKKTNIILGTSLIAGQIIYMLSGLKLAKAPRNVYLSLLYAPFFILWKLSLLIRVALGRDKDGWKRTDRNHE